MYSMSSYRPAPAMTRVDIAVVNFETLQRVTEIIHQLWAQASAPPPNVTPADDKRPMHWCELSKAGDMYMLCKEGSLVDIGLGCGWRKELVQFLHNCFLLTTNSSLMSIPLQTQTLPACGQNLRWTSQAGVAQGCPMQQGLHQCWKACGEGPPT